MTKQEKILKRAVEMTVYAHLDMMKSWPGCHVICPNKPCAANCTRKIANHFIRKAKEELK